MLVLVVSMMLCAPASVEVHYMPLGTQLKLQSGEQVRYFTFDEYKLLLKLDGDLWDMTQRLVIYKDLDLKYGSIVSQKDIIIKTLQDDKLVLTEQLKRSDENWRAAEKRYIDAAGGPIWPYVVGAVGAVVGIVGSTLYLASLAR